MPNLVSRFCKTPIYAADADVYLHINGASKCVKPQVPELKNVATPFEENTSYPAYRAELISDMTDRTVSYPHEPDKLLEMVLADARHFVDAELVQGPGCTPMRSTRLTLCAFVLKRNANE